MLDLHTTARCPHETCCHICGCTSNLRVVTYTTRLGVYCASVCADCIGAVHAMPVFTNASRVGAHCEHLGIYLDQMADALFGDQENV